MKKHIATLIVISSCIFLYGAASVYSEDSMPPAEDAAAEVRKFLDSCAAKWEAIETLRQEYITKAGFTVPKGNMLYTQTESIDYRRGGWLKVSAADWTLYKTPDALIMLREDGGKQTYTHIPLDDMEAVLRDTISLDSLTLDSAWLMTPPDGRDEILEDFLDDQPDARVLPDEEWNGKTYHILVVEGQDASFVRVDVWIKYWVDPGNGIFVRGESIQTPDWVVDEDEDEKDLYSAWAEKVMFSSEITSLAVNEPVPDEVFIFVPPEEAKEEVMAADEPIQTTKGGKKESAAKPADASFELDRFELSGKEAPAFELVLLDGGTFSMAEQKGKVVVLDFWATWCGPCMKSLPHMKTLAEHYADNPDVVFLGVNRDKEGAEDKVKKAVEKLGLPFPSGMDVNNIKTDFAVSGIPCMVIINRDGIIQGRRSGYHDTLDKDLIPIIDSILAGEELASAKPMTEEETAALGDVCENCGGRHGRSSSRSKEEAFPETLFKKRWNTAIPSTENTESISDGDKVKLRAATRWVAAQEGTRVNIYSTADGSFFKSREIPDELAKPNIKEATPHWLYLRHPDGDYLLAYRGAYTTRVRQDRVSYEALGHYLTRVPLTERMDGWTVEAGKGGYGYQLVVWPVSEVEDVLLEISYRNLSIRQANGDVVWTTRLQNNSTMELLYENGQASILIMEKDSMTAYDLIWPPADAGAEPAAE